ncbi:MAG: hypothetical protein H6521_14130 [Mycolicibacterium sp.]|nr:hypothetical protein [Mycolicibacterium sp.]
MTGSCNGSVVISANPSPGSGAGEAAFDERQNEQDEAGRDEPRSGSDLNSAAAGVIFDAKRCSRKSNNDQCPAGGGTQDDQDRHRLTQGSPSPTSIRDHRCVRGTVIG